MATANKKTITSFAMMIMVVLCMASSVRAAEEKKPEVKVDSSQQQINPQVSTAEFVTENSRHQKCTAEISKKIDEQELQISILSDEINALKHQVADDKKGALDSTVSSLSLLLTVFGVLATLISLLFIVLGFLGWGSINKIKKKTKSLLTEKRKEIDLLISTSHADIKREVDQKLADNLDKITKSIFSDERLRQLEDLAKDVAELKNRISKSELNLDDSKNAFDD
jgi:peptidoglycan hydrolase CwlO-like protein